MPKHYFSRLETLDYLIRIKATGSPKRLCGRLGVSERTVYEYIDILKSLGAPIEYCKSRESYFYATDGQFNFHFVSEDQRWLRQHDNRQ